MSRLIETDKKVFLWSYVREVANKNSSLNGRAIKRREGGGDAVKGRAIKEKKLFWEPFFSNIPTAIKLEGGRGLGLNGRANKRRPFFILRLP